MTYRQRGSATKHMGVQYWCAGPLIKGEKRGPLILFYSLPQTENAQLQMLLFVPMLTRGDPGGVGYPDTQRRHRISS